MFTKGTVLLISLTWEEGEGQSARNQSFGELLPGFFIDLASLLYTAWKKKEKTVLLTSLASKMIGNVLKVSDGNAGVSNTKA